MKLYGYYRSSAAYRVRIALNLKALAYETVAVDLRTGEQRSAAYLSRAPQGLVPALELDDGSMITQSTAIMEYLEQCWPSPALLPETPLHRARVRALAALITHDVHPLNNQRVLRYLSQELGVSEAASNSWYHHWISLGFDALQAQLKGPFCDGEAPGLADVCLVPQIYNARRFGMDIANWPLIAEIEARCLDMPAFADARPEAQADCPEALRASGR